MENIKFRAWDKEYKFMTDTFYLGSLNAGDGYDHDWKVMLYTGMKDKHGIEICEGDILSHEWPVEAKVISECVKYTRGCFWLGDRTLADIPAILCDSEIIGNIYEDPELIE